MSQFAKSIALILGCFGCGCKEELPKEIVDLAEAIGEVDVIYRYRFKGAIVYFIPASDALNDGASSVHDQNGHFLCSPDGGISGYGDGRCPDFFEERKNGKIVWQHDHAR